MRRQFYIWAIRLHEIRLNLALAIGFLPLIKFGIEPAANTSLVNFGGNGQPYFEKREIWLAKYFKGKRTEAISKTGFKIMQFTV